MKNINEHDIIRLLDNSRFEINSLKLNSKGTVVFIYEKDGVHEAYEIEFFDGEKSLGVFTIYPNEVQKIWDVETKEYL